MHIKDFLESFAAIMIVAICSLIIFFWGYRHGEMNLQGEAIKRNFARFDIQNHKFIFQWNDKI
jgi:hypothetical protein